MAHHHLLMSMSLLLLFMEFSAAAGSSVMNSTLSSAAAGNKLSNVSLVGGAWSPVQTAVGKTDYTGMANATSAQNLNTKLSSRSVSGGGALHKEEGDEEDDAEASADPSNLGFRSASYAGSSRKRKHKRGSKRPKHKLHSSKYPYSYSYGHGSKGKKYGLNFGSGIKISFQRPSSSSSSSSSKKKKKKTYTPSDSRSKEESTSLALKQRRALETLIEDISNRKLRLNMPQGKLFGPLSYTAATRRSILCELKKYPPLTYSRHEEPFSKSGIGKWFPTNPVIKFLRGDRIYNSCALVSSAGSIAGSNLGKEIDSHDVVMRFNGGDEDVGKYGRDIGRKTSISMLNNNRIKKLVTNKTVFPKKRIVVGWEACYFKGARRTPKECYAVENNYISHLHWSTENWNTVPNYMRWRYKNPSTKAFLTVEKWLYQLTDVMQKFSPYRLYGGNPPSTGFIGFAALLHNCKVVHVYHMVPPYSPVKKPYYYYSAPSSSDKLPLEYLDKRLTHQHLMEKTLLMKMNTASLEEAYLKGHVVVPGVSEINCS